MIRPHLILSLLVSMSACTSKGSPDATEGEVPTKAASSPADPGAEPATEPPPPPSPAGFEPVAELATLSFDASSEAFVWAAGELGSTCFSGCDGSASDRGSESLRLSLDPSQRLVVAKQDGWSRPLELAGPFDGRVVSCAADGPVGEVEQGETEDDLWPQSPRQVFVVAGPTGAADYRVWRLDEATGEVVGVAQRSFGAVEGLRGRELQIACTGAEGLRVFSRLSLASEGRLVVDVIGPDGRGRGTRELSAAILDVELPDLDVFLAEPAPPEAGTRYTFVGGLDPSQDEPKPEPLRLEVERGGELSFRAELGDARSWPTRALAVDDLIVVAITDASLDSRVLGLDAATGAQRWEAPVGGADYEDHIRRPMALVGTGGGAAPELYLEQLSDALGGLLMFARIRRGDYLNLIDLGTGAVVLRRIESD